jgi:hypothetical protein
MLNKSLLIRVLSDTSQEESANRHGISIVFLKVRGGGSSTSQAESVSGSEILQPYSSARNVLELNKGSQRQSVDAFL